MRNLAARIFYFYYDGFRSMTLGKRLWIIIIAKLIIFFLILKVFFFPDILKEGFPTDRERGDHVIEELTKPK